MTRSNLVTRALTVGALSVTLLACPPTPPANTDAGPVDAGDCSGTIGCACVNGACTSGECVGGTCTDCRRGEADCICRSNDTCNAGLRCTTGRCVTCPAGELNCACGTGDTCGNGLVCTNGVCVTNTCVAGSENCPCRGADPKCDQGYCDTMNLCQACSNDIVGCPCTAGTCAGTTVCDTGTSLCRAQKSCADLVAANQCGANQACTEATNGADAQCQAGVCKPNFKWNGTTCVACATTNCAMEPACATDGGVDFCTADNRVCLQQGQSATCGACLQGFTQNPSGACVAVPTCGNTTCAWNQYCDRTGGGAVCSARPCANENEAQVEGSTTCTACTISCAGRQGVSGRLYPFRYQGGCLCETLDGWYYPLGGALQAERCDEDGDGWVVDEADDDAVRNAPVLAANARCNIKKIDRFRLYDEYGIAVDVLSCQEGPLKASPVLPDGGTTNGGLPLSADGGVLPGPDGGSPCTRVPIRLLETARNDGATTVKPPAYRANTGRLIDPAEVNSLTKGCVSPIADFNDNGKEDIDETQLQPSSIAFEPDRMILHRFAYFMELTEARVEGNALVLRERNRCQPEFPLRYQLGASPANPVDLWTPGTDSPYWRSCMRKRDPSFDSAATTVPGYDFAQWSCDATSGQCPLDYVPHPTIANPQPTMTLLRDHGLCRLNGAPPADGRWRGMNHHSQFKCVRATDGASVGRDRNTGEFGTGLGKLTMNVCNAKACTSPTDPACSRSLSTAAGEAQTRQPVIECTPTAGVVVDDVGFAAVNFRPYRANPPSQYDAGVWPNQTYQGGCINEDDDETARYLCPYPEFTIDSSLSNAAFGRYSCYGKSSNFLWCCDGNNAANRSTLYWSPDAGAPANNSVFR